METTSLKAHIQDKILVYTEEVIFLTNLYGEEFETVKYLLGLIDAYEDVLSRI